MKNDFNGKISVSEQAEHLSKHGHLVGIVRENNSTHFIKCYTFNGNGYVVIYYDTNKPVQIRKRSIKEINIMAACATVNFGGF